MESPTKNNQINQQIDAVSRCKTGEWMALGFSVFFGLIMLSAGTDIVLGGAITSLLAGSIPFIASVVLLPVFSWLVLLGSTIAVGICLLSIAWHRNNALINLLSKIQTEEKSKDDSFIIDKNDIIDESKINEGKNNFEDLVIEQQVDTLSIDATSKNENKEADKVQIKIKNSKLKQKLSGFQTQPDKLQKNIENTDENSFILDENNMVLKPYIEDKLQENIIGKDNRER